MVVELVRDHPRSRILPWAAKCRTTQRHSFKVEMAATLALLVASSKEAMPKQLYGTIYPQSLHWFHMRVTTISVPCERPALLTVTTVKVSVDEDIGLH